MTCPTYVNCLGTVTPNKPKALIGLSQKATPSVAPPHGRSTRTHRTAGVLTGANSFVSLLSNLVSPTSRPKLWAGVSARTAVGVPGKGNWKKQMPLRNRVDRSRLMTLLRKRADFQSVMRGERTGITFEGGNSK